MFKSPTFIAALVGILAAGCKSAGIEVADIELQSFVDGALTFATVASPLFIAVRNRVVKK